MGHGGDSKLGSQGNMDGGTTTLSEWHRDAIQAGIVATYTYRVCGQVKQRKGSTLVNTQCTRSSLQGVDHSQNSSYLSGIKAHVLGTGLLVQRLVYGPSLYRACSTRWMGANSLARQICRGARVQQHGLC